ncbi:MAG: enoyl-[acyl-carrier-protein] reductase FabK [Fretibacterium sp.]|uniref:enoyl-[acyl-carrier-protein] reductase FabK n=1 Tax=Fretibacterium sp. OH1220_COT-178 TaxID=2491047 RepID=UPI000F5DE431|nr:enoyl-[acyl-carrier-protein] reductase FabK [Fretibacterium sp. OH1220_COT-178]MDO4785633.1 enoyl-[acyl-carrier-protein] reductase FabK [Fretibacterium sp.]RRD64684.1 enoyl-[acyl-carrier-protein] reductase FabK [Fretibacterium sp. OH1220_COT-178]
MIVNNRVCKLLGTEYPLLQGGMAWVANAPLAAAVSNAGGIGIIAAAATPPDILDKEILKAKSLTDRPFGLNIMLMSPTAPDALELAARHRLPIVTTGAGSPGKVLERLKPLGTIVIPVVASVSQARRVEKQGADAVVAEGMEAGGHIGELTTMVLVPQIAEAVKIPVVAAGGIADGRGVAAAFALGAEGVQLGTRFICCTECTVHPNFKQAVLDARDRSTAVTGQRTGHPVRCLSNKLTAEFDKLDARLAPLEEIEALGTGRLRAAVVDGDVDWGSLMSGQSAAMVNDILPARQILERLFGEAREVLRKIQGSCDLEPK